ncbi:MAG: PaaI family thioesterase [Pseudomonadota bacterium]
MRVNVSLASGAMLVGKNQTECNVRSRFGAIWGLVEMASTAHIQSFYPTHFRACFGCGEHNRLGLGLRTFWRDGKAITHWRPTSQFVGASDVLHGGITALLMDEVAGAAAFVEAHRRRGVALGEPLDVDFVTANLSVDYRRPVRITSDITLIAAVENDVGASGRKIYTRCRLLANNDLAAEGELLFVILGTSRASP